VQDTLLFFLEERPLRLEQVHSCVDSVRLQRDGYGGGVFTHGFLCDILAAMF
jgi:hypothetical protein